MLPSRIFSIITIIAGIIGTGLLPAFGASIDAWAPGWGTKTVAVLSSLSLAAGLIVAVVKSQHKDAPATSIVENAPVVPPGTPLTPPVPTALGTVVSTSSTLLPANQPAKGTES